MASGVEIKNKLVELVKAQYGVEFDDMSVEIPPRTELGDLAFPAAFELAKRLKASTGEKKNPRDIAAGLAAGIREMDGIDRVEIAGPGYLNVFFDRARAFQEIASPGASSSETSSKEKIIVEHTSINPNKAAHIGHVRNSVLGDTVVRILRSTGENVEVHNYIDNTGVQVADVVVGFIYLEKLTLDEIKAIAERKAQSRAESFDYYCWDLYARVGQWYEESKSNLELRSRTLHDIEEGGNATAEIAEYVSSRIVNCHLDTMSRLDISYDLLARESEILHLHFWSHAFEKLKASGVIVYENDGRNKGCWVMRAEEGQGAAGDESEHDADKIIVRSNGTVTYTGKDIAYHLWKLGKLGLDFQYHRLRKDHRDAQVWITSSEPGIESRPDFGNGTAFLNVIDVGQSYPQANVKRAVLLLAASEEERRRVSRSAHLAYEKVTLSPEAAKELGVDAEGSVSMSGRKGLGVKADDLIDRLEASALGEVQARHVDISETEQRKIANQIAVAALRYFLLKYTRTSIIAFDFNEALSFEGETGPYIQYSAVRANNIFRKLGSEKDSFNWNSVEPAAVKEFFSGESGDDLWSIVYFAMRLDDVAQIAAAGFEPTHVAKYAFQLAKQFNLFYHNYHILSEANSTRKTLLLGVADVVRKRLEKALSLLGIETPERM